MMSQRFTLFLASICVCSQQTYAQSSVPQIALGSSNVIASTEAEHAVSPNPEGAAVAASGWVSSPADSSSLDSALPASGMETGAGMDAFAQAIKGSTGMRPFSAVGVAVKVGVEGIGFDVATPLSQKFNLRVGASFFEYTHSQTVDGIVINPDLKFRKAAASLDFYPFGGSFRISPGFVFYNGNQATATANVPGGSTFTLNDVTYTSSTTDPVRGSAEIGFGNKAAPSITVGFGNMIPRKGGHWSVPFEIGFEYIGTPTFVYSLAGTACNQYGCMNVATSPDIQANLKAEQAELNSDISGLRFYPILSIGVGYRF